MRSSLGRFTRTEIKLGLTLVIISALFMHWGGWSENSLFDLTRAIVDRGTLTIDPDIQNTGDRSVVNGHYYSNKAPGGAFLAVPVYAAWKGIASFLPVDSLRSSPDPPLIVVHDIHGVPIIVDMGLDLFTRIAILLVCLVPIVLFGLTAVLLYRLAGQFTANTSHQLLVPFLYGFGTIGFIYSHTFATNIMGSFFTISSFYQLVKTGHHRTNRQVMLAGFAAGFGVAVDYWVSLTLPIIGLYAILTAPKHNKLQTGVRFCVAALIGLLPLLLYNTAILGTPFDLVIRHQDPAIWISSSTLGFKLWPDPFVLIRLLIGPYRGLFVYSPLLILGVIGLFVMAKTHRAEALTIGSLFLIFLWAIASYWYWWGGYVFGQRFFLPIVPFLVLPIVFIMKRYGKIVWLLFALSFVINLAGLQQWEEKVSSVTGAGMDQRYKDRVSSFTVLENPLIDRYLPLMLAFGPRSRLLESLAAYRMDIRDVVLPQGRANRLQIEVGLLEPMGFVVVHIRWLALFMAVVIASLIWRRSLYSWLGQRIRWLWFLEALLLPVLFVRTTPIIYDANWHTQEPSRQGTYRWMSQNASLKLYQTSKSHSIISFDAWSDQIPRTLNLWVNEQPFSMEIPPYLKKVSTRLVSLRRGVNQIRFESAEGCKSQPDDIRCRSLAIAGLTVTPIERLSSILNFDENWYEQERSSAQESLSDGPFRWMSQDGLILIYEPAPHQAILTFRARTAHGTTRLSISFNDKLQGTYAVGETPKTLHVPLELEMSNSLQFHVEQGCVVLADMGLSDDTRCLGLAISDLTLIPGEDSAELSSLSASQFKK